jgi:outer membrane protein assembly factor BamB
MGGILAIDVVSGKVKWHHKRMSADAPYAAPLVTMIAGRETVIVPSTAFGLTALDAATGELVWQLKQSPFTQRCVGAVTRNGDMLIVTTGSGAGSRLAIGFELAKTGPPVQKWSLNRATSYVPTPLTIGSDTLFWGDNGIVLRVNSVTGTTVYQERIADAAFASPIRMQNAILNITRKGEVVRVTDTQQPGPPTMLALGEESHASLSVFGNQVVARTLSKVHVLA